jgi:hypothetical protein
MNDSSKDIRTAWAEIILRTIRDKRFKQKFINDPVPILNEYGLKTEEGKQYIVLEDTESEKHFVLPPKKANFKES